VKGTESAQPAPPTARAGPDAEHSSGIVTLDIARLFAGGQSEVRLLHRGQEYRLRITRQGKLILTK
jgi:hemin uptake protein HemP